MSSYSSSEVKSGFFILLSIAALLVMTFIVGGMRGGEKMILKIRFGYVGGLVKGAPVYFAGREVGKVKELTVENGEERPVVIAVEIPRTLVIRKNSEAYVDTLGMMGEKMVEITPGTKTESVLAQGGIIEGMDPVPMHDLIAKVTTLSDSLNPLVLRLNDLMQKNSETIQELIVHMNGTTKGLDKLINSNQEQIAKIIANLEQTSSNVRDMTEEIKHHPWRLVRKG